MPRAAFELIEVVADGHGQGKELFQGFLRSLELDGNPAGFEVHTRGQVLELLVGDVRRGRHEKLWSLDPLFPEAVNDAGDLAPALHLVIAVVAPGKAAQASDQAVPIGKSAGPHVVRDTGRHDLLGPPAADIQQELDRGPIHKRPGGSAQLFDNVIDLIEPRRFGRHSDELLASLC